MQSILTATPAAELPAFITIMKVLLYNLIKSQTEVLKITPAYAKQQTIFVLSVLHPALGFLKRFPEHHPGLKYKFSSFCKKEKNK